MPRRTQAQKDADAKAERARAYRAERKRKMKSKWNARLKALMLPRNPAERTKEQDLALVDELGTELNRIAKTIADDLGGVGGKVLVPAAASQIFKDYRERDKQKMEWLTGRLREEPTDTCGPIDFGKLREEALLRLTIEGLQEAAKALGQSARAIHASAHILSTQAEGLAKLLLPEDEVTDPQG